MLRLGNLPAKSRENKTEKNRFVFSFVSRLFPGNIFSLVLSVSFAKILS